MAAMERMDSQEIEEDELSDLETAIDNVTDRLSIFLDDSYKLNPHDPSTIMLSPEDEVKDFDLKLTIPDSPVKAMEFELQMKSLVETVHINCEQTLQDSSQESFSAPIQMPETPPDTPVTSPTFSEQEDPVKDENEQAEKIFSCNTFVFGPKGHFLAQTTAKDNSPLAKKVVEVMTAVTDKLSEMSDNSGFQMVNEEYTMSDDSMPNIMAVESSVIAVHSQPPVTRQISDVSDDLEDLAKECKTDQESSSSSGESDQEEEEREDSPEYITPVLLLPTPPPQAGEQEEEELSTPRSDSTSDASYSEASYSECDSCKNAQSGHVHVDLLLPSTIDEDECRSEVMSEVETEPVELIAESLSEDDPAVEVDIPLMEVCEVIKVKSVPSVMLEEPSLDRDDAPEPEIIAPSVPSVVLETPSFEDDAPVNIDLDIPCMMSEPSMDLDNMEEPTIDIDTPAVDKLYFEECQIQLTQPSVIMDDQNSVNGYSDLDHEPDEKEETSPPRPKLERIETIDSLYANEEEKEEEESTSSSSSESDQAELTMPVLSEAELDMLRSEVVLGVPVEPTPSPEVPGDGIVIEGDLAMDVKFPVHVESEDKVLNVDQYLKDREEENGEKMRLIENDEDDQYLDDGRRFSEVMRIPDDEFKPSKEVIEEETLETGVVVLETEKYVLEKEEDTLRITNNAAIPCEPVPLTLELDSPPNSLEPVSMLEDSLGLVTPATPTLKAEIDARLQAADDSSSDDSLTDDEGDDHDENLSPEFKSILDQMTSSAAEDKGSLKKSDSSCSDSSRSTVENELLNEIDIEKSCYERSVPLEMSNDLMSTGVEDMRTPEPEVEIAPLEREHTLEPEVEIEVKTPVPDEAPKVLHPVPDEAPKVLHPVLVKTDIMHNDNTIEYDSTIDYGSQFSLDPPAQSEPPKQLDTSIILDDNNVSMTRSPNTTLNTTAPNISLNGTLNRENKLSIKTKIPGKDPRVGKSFYLAFKIKMEGFNLKAKDVEKNAEVELWREGIKLSIIPKFKKGYFLYKIRNCSLRDSGMYSFKAKMLDYFVQCAEDVNVIEKGTRRSKSTTSIGSLGSLGSILSLNKNRNHQS